MKAWSAAASSISSPRPRSGCRTDGRPMSWKASSVKRQPLMAGDAARLADEELRSLSAPPRSRAAVVALEPAVEAGLRRDEGALERSRARRGCWSSVDARIVRERRGKAAPRMAGSAARRAAALARSPPISRRVLDRPARLRLEARRAPVPEEGQAPGEVPQRRRAPRQGLAVVAQPARDAVGEGQRRIVAGGAGHGAVAGQARVRKQGAAEVDLLRRDRIARRRRDRGRPGEGGTPRRKRVVGGGAPRERAGRQRRRNGQEGEDEERLQGACTTVRLDVVHFDGGDTTLLMLRCERSEPRSTHRRLKLHRQGCVLRGSPSASTSG